jgi:hypothetical protein
MLVCLYVALEIGIFELAADDAVMAFWVSDYETNLVDQWLDGVLLENIGTGFIIVEYEQKKKLREHHCVVEMW